MPLLPQLSLLQDGEKIPLTDNRDVEMGDSFLIYCNVTLDIGHVIRIKWRKNVSRIVFVVFVFVVVVVFVVHFVLTSFSIRN